MTTTPTPTPAPGEAFDVEKARTSASFLFDHSLWRGMIEAACDEIDRLRRELEAEGVQAKIDEGEIVERDEEIERLRARLATADAAELFAVERRQAAEAKMATSARTITVLEESMRRISTYPGAKAERALEARADLAEAALAEMTKERDGLAAAISSDIRRWPVWFGSPYADALAFMAALAPGPRDNHE